MAESAKNTSMSVYQINVECALNIDIDMSRSNWQSNSKIIDTGFPAVLVANANLKIQILN